MIKGMKKLICIGMVLILLFSGLSGCKGGDDNGTPVKGGYRETELVMPEGYEQVSNPMFLPDGRLVMVALRTMVYDEQPGNPVPLPADLKEKLMKAAGGVIAETGVSEGSEDQGSPGTSENADEAADTAAGEAADTDDDKGMKKADPDIYQEYQEYTPPERKVDILIWQDISGEPTVDPLELPQNSYFDSQNALITDNEGNPVLRVNSYDQEKGVQMFMLYWLPEIKAAGKDAQPVPPVREQALNLGEMYPASVVILQDGAVAVSSWESVSLYGKDGKKIKDLSITYTYQMTRAGNNLVVIEGEKSEIVYYDTTTFEETARRKANRTVLNNAQNMVGLNDGTIYFFGQNGVSRMDPVDTTVNASSDIPTANAEVVIDSLQYSLADPNMYTNSFTVGNDKQIVITGNSNNMMYQRSMLKAAAGMVVTESSSGEYTGPRMRIFIYTWDPELDLSNKKVITVSTLFTDQILRIAAFEFQKKHPDVQIKVTQYYDKMEDQMKWSDFIRTVNTDILSGKTADVMFLDNLPLKSYMRRGILMDLSPHIDMLGGAENLNMGIVNGMRSSDGKLYALPLTFTTYALIGRKNVIDQVTDLQSLLTLNLEPDQTALVPQQKDGLFQQLLQANMPAFIDEKSGNYRFDSPEFIGFLELFDRIYNEAQIPPPELPENPTEEDYNKFDYSFYENNQLNRYKGKIAMSMTTLGNLDSLAHEYTLSGGENASWTFLPMVKDVGGAVFVPQTTLGVSARSKNQDIALEFVKMFFSDELTDIQNYYMWGFSIMKSQQEKAIQNMLEIAKQQEENEWKPEIYLDENTTVELKYLTEEQMRDIVDRLEECSVPMQFDQTLYEFLNEEIRPFLYGRKSAREAAEALQRRAAAYLAE